MVQKTDKGRLICQYQHQEKAKSAVTFLIAAWLTRLHGQSLLTQYSAWRSALLNGIDVMKIDTGSDEGAWEEHRKLMEQFNKLRAQYNAENDQAEKRSTE